MPVNEESLVRLLEFKKELRELLSKYEVTIGVDIQGDTHGLTENFEAYSKDAEITLAHYQAYIDASDLKED